MYLWAKHWTCEDQWSSAESKMMMVLRVSLVVQRVGGFEIFCNAKATDRNLNPFAPQLTCRWEANAYQTSPINNFNNSAIIHILISTLMIRIRLRQYILESRIRIPISPRKWRSVRYFPVAVASAVTVFQEKHSVSPGLRQAPLQMQHMPTPALAAPSAQWITQKHCYVGNGNDTIHIKLPKHKMTILLYYFVISKLLYDCFFLTLIC